MKNLFIFLIEVVFCIGLSLFCVGNVYGQTVFTQQYFENTIIPFPAGYTGLFSDNNPQETPWLLVSTKRTFCFDITFVDANNSITSIDMSCYTNRDVAPASVTLGYAMPIYVATAATGITTSTPSRIRQVNNAGGPPGSSLWNWCVTNIPGPYIGCTFTANGVITADIDTIAMVGRSIIP